MPTELRLSLAFILFLGCTSCERSGGASLSPSTEQPSPSTEQQSPNTERSAPGAQDSSAQEASKARSQTEGAAKDSESPRIEDRGIFPELNSKIDLSCPSWLSEREPLSVRYAGANFETVDGYFLCPSPATNKPLFSALTSQEQDRDGDQIPDQIDIVRGAKKAVANAASYQSHYLKLSYPGGDVPRSEGVCTDVIVRSLRNAGYDLQELVHEDLSARPDAYPMVSKPDFYIDHRRVRTLLPYFLHAFKQLDPDPADTAFPYLPGDIVFMNTMGDGQPEHLGIVSDRAGPSGSPLIINNWTDGTKTSEMDLLARVPVTHRFRVAPRLKAPKEERGLIALLRRWGLKLPENSAQALLVSTPLADSSGGTLLFFERTKEGAFKNVGTLDPVRVGRRGLGAGRGLSPFPGSFPSSKKEGDRRAPAGLFTLGTAFGRSSTPPYSGKGWPYRGTTTQDYWVDEAKSEHYNTWQTLPKGKSRPWSAEQLNMYSLGLVVKHNTADIVPGAGSAIFIHPWRSPKTATVGCTALKESRLEQLLEWLDPDGHPVFIQLPGALF